MALMHLAGVKRRLSSKIQNAEQAARFVSHPRWGRLCRNTATIKNQTQPCHSTLKINIKKRNNVAVLQLSGDSDLPGGRFHIVYGIYFMGPSGHLRSPREMNCKGHSQRQPIRLLRTQRPCLQTGLCDNCYGISESVTSQGAN